MNLPAFCRALTVAALCVCAAAGTSPPQPSNVRNVTEVLRGLLQMPELAPQAKVTSSRDFGFAALFHLVADGDAAAAEPLLEREFAAQDMDPKSRTFGQFRWRTSDATVLDYNAVDFNGLALGAILNGFGAELSPRLRAQAAPHVAAAIVALRNYDPRVGYTNAWLMDAVDLVLLGQAAGDGAAIALGERRMSQWIAFTKQNGIREFDSPTYYSVDIDALAEGARYARSADDRAAFRTSLDYFWTDIGANYLPAGGRISAPYSRDGNFLLGIGPVMAWIASEGWPGATFPDRSMTLEQVFVLDNARPGGYHPPASALELATSGPRSVRATWLDPELPRYAWIGKRIAIGCASGQYNHQDKMFAITFAGSSSPQISFALDGLGDPYGLATHSPNGGPRKTWHFYEYSGCVQEGATALVTMNPDPRLPPGSDRLTLNLLLPSSAQVAVDGRPVDLSQPSRYAVERDSVLTVTLGGATAAMRLFRADRATPSGPFAELVADREGLAHGAARLSIVLVDAATPPTAPCCATAFLVKASDDASPAAMAALLREARIAENYDDSGWAVSATSEGHRLSVARSAADRRVVDATSIDGRLVEGQPLELDGRDLASGIWARLPGGANGVPER